MNGCYCIVNCLQERLWARTWRMQCMLLTESQGLHVCSPGNCNPAPCMRCASLHAVTEASAAACQARGELGGGPPMRADGLRRAACMGLQPAPPVRGRDGQRHAAAAANAGRQPGRPAHHPRRCGPEPHPGLLRRRYWPIHPPVSLTAVSQVVRLACCRPADGGAGCRRSVCLGLEQRRPAGRRG